MIQEKTNNALNREWQKLSGKSQWLFALEHKDRIKVNLDNDDTYITFLNEENFEDSDDMNILTFDNYIGNSAGVEDLLEAIGIKAEGV